MKDIRTPGRQRGGFAMGLIVGLLVGLALALAVALYVTKAPNPFVNKVPQRSPVQDAAEAERNKNWDPNAGLAGKTPAKPATPGPAATATAPVTAPAPPTAAAPEARPVTPPAVATAPATRPSAPAAGRGEPSRDLAAGRDTAAAPATKPSPPVSTGGASDPFTYFVQAGAYGRSEDAEQQRARLAMLGIESRLTEREQAGRTVYRVRIGPFDRKEEADAAKEKLSDAGVDSALVRVQK